MQDEDHQQHGQGGIAIIPILPLGVLDDARGDHHNHRSERVAQHMQERGAHVHLAGAVRVSVAARRRFLRHHRRRRFHLVRLAEDVILVLVVVDGRQLRQLAVAVRVSVAAAVVQQEQPDDVHQQSDEADDEHVLRAVNDFDVNEALDGLDGDAEAERDEEHGVDECAEDLSSSPAERVLAPLLR